MTVKKHKIAVKDQEILESAKCREIIHEIMNFGVSQKQILILIKLLALEIENSDVMRKITETIDGPHEKGDSSNTTTILV